MGRWERTECDAFFSEEVAVGGMVAGLHVRKDGKQQTSAKPLAYPEKSGASSASADGLEGRKLGLHDAPGERRVCDVNSWRTAEELQNICRQSQKQAKPNKEVEQVVWR